MGKQLLLVFAAAALISTCTASRSSNFHFYADTIVQCMVQNPHAGRPGQPYSIPEDTPVVPFVPGEPGTVYLPQKSGFQSPVIGPLPRYIAFDLEQFLGNDLDSRVTSVGEEIPRRDPIVPGTVRPANVPVSSGSQPEAGVGTTVAPPQDYRQEIVNILNTVSNTVLLPPENIEVVADVAVRLPVERCNVLARWTRLPEGHFFPQWVSGAYCSGNNCSIPAGLHCNPVLREEALIPLRVLRWDCCWSIANRQWRWECGWRKVIIHLIGQCTCSCFDEYPVPFSHTGRISGMFRVHIDDLNT